MTPLLWRDFRQALGAFAAAPQSLSATNALVSARVRVIDGNIEDVNWAPMARVLIALATAAQDAGRREERRAAIGELADLALRLYAGDLGDNVIAAPTGPPSPIRQYRED